jgi:hypothetical protein
MTINAFELHDTTTAPASSGEILNDGQKAWGFVPNLHRVLAESPAALEAYVTLWGIAEKTGFSPVERNMSPISRSFTRTSACTAWRATRICHGWPK